MAVWPQRAWTQEKQQKHSMFQLWELLTSWNSFPARTIIDSWPHPGAAFWQAQGSWITLTVNFHPAEMLVHWDCAENSLLPNLVLFSLTTAAHRNISILRLEQLLKTENNLLSDLLWDACKKKKPWQNQSSIKSRFIKGESLPGLRYCMTSLSTFCLEEHKGNPRGSTTAKAAQKGSTRLSSVLSCWQQEALPAFSLPVPLQQVTTAPAHRHHIPGNDFHSSALSQRLPHTEDSQLCTNRLGKGNTDFPLQFHCAGPFILGYRPQEYIPTQPHGKATTAASDSPDGPSQLIPVGPSVTLFSQHLWWKA